MNLILSDFNTSKLTLI